MTSESVVRQILEGMPFDTATVRCTDCGCELEGTRVAAVGRSIEKGPWEITAVYCLADGPEIVPETPFGESVLAHARVGALADVLHQRHDPALLDVEIVDCALDVPGATA